VRLTTENLPDWTAKVVDLAEAPLPWWDETLRDPNSEASRAWRPCSQMLGESDALVVVTPEWSGMAPPAVKNFFLLCAQGDLAHKPGLIVAISGGIGGAYPVAELRSSSYKNTRICFIPDHLILRGVSHQFNGGTATDESVRRRFVYSLRVLGAYAEALGAVRRAGVIDLATYPFGL